MSFPYLPARFTADETLADALALACSRADDRAFYVREDAAVVARTEADRFASIDGLAMARGSLARHAGEYVAAVRYASGLLEQMQARGIAFDDGSKAPAADESEAEANMRALLAALDAANDAGQPAPTHLLVAVRGASQFGSR